MPAISVVIPTYCRSHTVLETLESVFAQTLANYEVIVVNDGAVDETARLLAPLVRSGQIRYFEQTNKGEAAARNRGLAEARGEFVAFLDDDDLWPEDKLQWQCDYLSKNADVLLVGGSCNLFYPDGTHGKTVVLHEGNITVETISRGSPFFSPGQTLIRRDVLMDAGGFDTSYWGVDDMDLWFRLALRGKLLAQARLALYYRIHEGNASRDVIKMYTNSFRMARRHTGLVDRADRTRLATQYYRWLYTYVGERVLDEIISLVRCRSQRRWTLRTLVEVFSSFVIAPELCGRFSRDVIRRLRSKVVISNRNRAIGTKP
jgi:glycosyltransferase involved in cell wall biosynthesis